MLTSVMITLSNAYKKNVYHRGIGHDFYNGQRFVKTDWAPYCINDDITFYTNSIYGCTFAETESLSTTK